MKKTIITVIVTAIVCIIGTSYAAYKLKAEQVSFDNRNAGLNSDNIQSAIDELGINLSSSKQLLAEAITNKGVGTSNSDSFETMASNIDKIMVGMQAISLGENITSYDLDNNSNLKNIDLSKLTSDNFYIKLESLYITSTQRKGHSTSDITRTGNSNTTITYNKDTHVVTIPSRSVSVDGNYTAINCYANYTLYVVY